MDIIKNSLVESLVESKQPNIIKFNNKEFSFNKPICDPIGFSQHTGECWHDTILQMLFFADRSKEIMQPLFYNLTDEEIQNKIMSSFKTEEINNKYSEKIHFIDPLKKIIIQYFIMVRNRFINHYNYINGHSDKETCILKIGRRDYNTMIEGIDAHVLKHATLKRNASRKLGIKTAQTAINMYKFASNLKDNRTINEKQIKKILENASSNNIILNGKEPGGDVNTIFLIFNMFIEQFNLPLTYDSDLSKIESTDFELIGINLTAILLTPEASKINKSTLNYTSKAFSMPFYLLKPLSPRRHILYTNPETSGSHACCFYKCNNYWMFYDDNAGNVRMLISDINNKNFPYFLKEHFLDANKPIVIGYYINNHIINACFLRTNFPENYMITHVYNETEWIDATEFKEDIIVIIHTWSLYNPGYLFYNKSKIYAGGKKRKTVRRRKH